MANIRGTNLSAAVVPFTTDDSYATHYAKYGNGGWQEVATIADRDAITTDRLEQGMVVYVSSESKAYVLKTLDLVSDPQVITWEDLKANIGLASVYTYKGQVNTIADLDNIQDPSVGDTYDVAENDHNYAWNGTAWDDLGGSQTIQVSELPTATLENVGKVYEYVGATTEDYTNGYFYQCVAGEPVETSVTFTPHAGVETVVSISPEDFQAFIEQWCEGRSFTAADVTHGGIGYYSSDRYSMTIYTDVPGQFAYASWTIAELEEAGFSFDPYLSAQQGVDFTCTIAHTPYYWMQKNVQPEGDNIQVEVLPEPTEENEGQIVEYIGATIPIEEGVSITSQETTDPCEIIVDLETFKEFVDRNFEATNTNGNFTYNGSTWSIIFTVLGESFYGETGDLSYFGITLDYGEGEVHEGDEFTLYYTKAQEPYYVNGYFYQSGRYDIPSVYGARLNASEDNYHLDYVSKEDYEHYITEELHEELVDADYTFTYSDNEQEWMLDNQPVNLQNYGIELHFDEVEVINPTSWDNFSYSFDGDPDTTLSIDINLATLEAYYGPSGLDWINPDDYDTELDFSFKYLGLDGNDQPLWDTPEGRQTTDLSPYGITATFNPSPSRSSGGMSFKWHAKSIGYELATPTDGDTITSHYVASTFERKWLQKKVQNDNDKIDKWDLTKFYQNEPSEANEGLIVQYVGETETYDSRVNANVGWEDGATVSVEVNKAELEAALEHVEIENPLQQYWNMTLSWNSNDGKWDTTVYLNGEEVTQNSCNTTELQGYGVYISIDPDEHDLRDCDISLDYEPAHEGDWHNGYFYQSQKITEEELFEVSNDNELRNVLDEENPYTLDAETLVESQHLREGEGYDGQFCYGPTVTQNNSEPEDGWYDEWRGEHDPQTGYPYRVDLENDFGVTLNYREHNIQANRNAVALSALSTNSDSVYISKIALDTFENGLLNYSIVNELPTEPTVFYFQCYGGDSEFWRVNDKDISDNHNVRVYLDSDFGIYYDRLRAPTFIQGDSITVYYTPDVQPENKKELYCMVEGRFGNVYPDANGGYIVSLDTSVLEAELGTLPTTITYYTWECTDGDTNAWKLDGNPADPADYGIILSSPSRAPTTPFLTGDTFTLMYKPADKDIFRVSKSRFDGSANGGGLDYLDIDLFKAYGYKSLVDNGAIYEGDLVQLSFRNTVDGSYSDARWYCDTTGAEYTSDQLASIGIVLNNPRAPYPYTSSDYILIDYIPVPYSFNDEPERDYRFNLTYRPESIYYDWVQKDVQPGVTDYNDLDNKPAIDGVILTSETTAQDLSGSFVDLTSNQKADGTKIINELFRQSDSNLQAVASTTYTSSRDWGCSSFLPRDENSVFVFGILPADMVGNYWYNQEEKEYPAFGIIEKSSGELVDHGLYGYDWLYPLNPDPNMIATYDWYYRYGESTSNLLSGFASNVVEWIDTQNNNKRWFFAITSPCILAKIDPDYLNASDYRQAVVASWQLYDFDYYRGYKISLNRLRVQGDYIYAFQELGNGTAGGVYPVKFDIRNGYAEIPMGYSNRFSAGGYEATGLGRGWGRNVDKDSGFDYQVMTTGGTDVAYLYIRNGNEHFYDVYGNYIEYPHGTIYKFPLDSMNPSCDNLAYLGYQFNNDGNGKCEIRNILKLDERYLLVYAYEDASSFLYLNLFDTSVDRVVARIYTKCQDFSDDYSVYKESDHVYKVSGFLDHDAERLYQVTINTAAQSFQERDMEFDYSSAYNQIMGSVPDYLGSSHTIFMWDDVDLVQDQETGDYRFETPIAYTRRQIQGGEKNYPIWMGVNRSLDRYATEGFVNSVLDASGYITADYLWQNGYATQSWCNDFNISYDNLNYLPTLNGMRIVGNYNSRYYRIIDDYGISITDTQMIMNNKGIKYDTPFQIATVIESGGSEYQDFIIQYVVPSQTENNVYYQVVNFRFNNDPTWYTGVFKYNTLLGEREPVVIDTQNNATYTEGRMITGSYLPDVDTFVGLFIPEYNPYPVYTLCLSKLSEDISRYGRITWTVDFPTGNQVQYGSPSLLTGLYIDDNQDYDYRRSDTQNAVSVMIYNTSSNTCFKGNIEIDQNGSNTRYFKLEKFRLSPEDFASMKNNMIRNTEDGEGKHGVGLLLPARVSDLWTKESYANQLGIGEKYSGTPIIFTKDDLDPNYPNALLGVSISRKLGETSWQGLRDISNNTSDNITYDAGLVFGFGVDFKVWVDGVQVYNFNTIRTLYSDLSNYTAQIKFDTAVPQGSTVEYSYAYCASSSVVHYDGSSWSDINDTTGVIPYLLPNDIEAKYYKLRTTGDSTYHFVLFGQNSVDGSYGHISTSADGDTWSNPIELTCLDSMTGPSVGIEYIDGYFYVVSENGSTFKTDDFVNWTSCANALPDSSYSVTDICTDGEKLYTVMKYRVTEMGYSTQRLAISEYDPSNDHWNRKGIVSPFYYTYGNKKATLMYSGTRFYLFIYEENSVSSTGFSANSDYCVSDDLITWMYGNPSLQGNQVFGDDYYSLFTFGDGTSTVPVRSLGGDGKGGIHFIKGDNINNNKTVLATNCLGVMKENYDTTISVSMVKPALTHYTSTQDYHRAGITSYDLIRISKDITLLEDDPYLGQVGNGSSYTTISQYNTFDNSEKMQVILKGLNGKTYMAPCYTARLLSDSSTHGVSYPRPIRSWDSPGIYLTADNTALFYEETSSSNASDASRLNGYDPLYASSYYEITSNDGTSWARFKQCTFRVMCGYKVPINSTIAFDYNSSIGHIGSRGTGYQVGETITLRGVFGWGREPCILEVTSVDENGGITSLTVTQEGFALDEPRAYSAQNIMNNAEYSGSGTGFNVYLNGEKIYGPHNDAWTFGNLSLKVGDYFTPDINRQDTWKKTTLVIDDDALVELKGSFENEGGIAKIEAIDTHAYNDSADLSKFYFYCLITTNNGTVKAYKSQDISFQTSYDYIRLEECSPDLEEATTGSNYMVSYLAQYAFVYTPDNFYITSPAFVNFKGKITDLYDTNFMELYTSHPTNGFIVPALGNKNFRNPFTKASDFMRYHYSYDNVQSLGSNWEDGVHTVTSEFELDGGETLEVKVTFETSNGMLKQVFSVTPDVGNLPLNSEYVSLENPDTHSSADAIILEFECIDLNNSSFVPSIERYGITKRGYQVKNDMDDTDGYSDSNSVPTIYAVKQYVQEASSNVHSAVLTLEASDWDSNTNELTITGISDLTVSSIVLPVPHPNSMTDYMAANIVCTGQNNGELTFTCTNLPSNDITINIIIM